MDIQTVLSRLSPGWVSLCCSLLLVGCALAPSQTLNDENAAIELPAAASISRGQLDNGLLYYIDQHDQRATTVEFRLKVDFGSLDEADHQLGYAHFIEHMAFNGTEHYPGNELIAYLQSLGMSFGHDINAHTAFNETVYKLSVPADQPELIHQAYQVMADWAGGILFDEAEVQSEKGVIIEEWRLNYSGEEAAWLQRVRALYGDSDYQRLPIGTPESVRNATADALRELYHHAYRADVMTLYVSGHVDVLTAKQRIEQSFGALPASDGYAPNRPMLDHSNGRYWVSSDESITQDYLEHGRLFDGGFKSLDSAAGQRERFFAEMLRLVLQERTQVWSDQPGSGVRTEAYFYGLDDGTPVIEFSVFPQGPLTQEHLNQAEGIWQSLLQYGISEAEYRLYSQRLLQEWQQIRGVMNNADSAGRVDWFMARVEEGMGPVDWRDLPEVILNLTRAYNADWFNQWLKSEVADLPHFSGLMLRPSTATEWSTDSFVEAVDAAGQLPVTAGWLEHSEERELTFMSTPGRVESVTETELDNLTRIELENGLVVWFYRTEVEANRLVLNLVSRGGSAGRSYDDAVLGVFWPHVLNETTPGGLSRTEFNDWQQARNIGGSAYDQLLESGLYWEGSADGIQSMLTLVGHYMHPMTLNEATMDVFIAGTAEYLQSFYDTPQGRLETGLAGLVEPHPNLMNLQLEDLEGISAERLNDFHGRWLSQGLGVELFVVGDTDLNSVVKAAEATLAGKPLPAPEAQFIEPYQWQAADVLEVKAHQDDRTDLSIRLRAPEPIWEQRERILTNVSLNMVETHLLQLLREQLGDTYSIWLAPDQASPQLPQSAWNMATSTSPDRADAVITMMEEALTGAEEWLTEAGLAATKRQMLESHRRSQASLDSLLSDLIFYTRPDRHLADYGHYEAMINSYTLADVQRSLAFWAGVEDRLVVKAIPF